MSTYFIHVSNNGSEYYFTERQSGIATLKIEITENTADGWLETAYLSNQKVDWLHDSGMPLVPVPPGRGWQEANAYAAKSTIWERRRIRLGTARRYRDIVNNLLSDQGGLESCAEARLQLIRRFAAAAVIAEQMETRMAAGEPINIAEHALLTSSTVRVAQRVGINRRSKTIMPTVRDYLEESAVPKEAAE